MPANQQLLEQLRTLNEQQNYEELAKKIVEISSMVDPNLSKNNENDEYGDTIHAFYSEVANIGDAKEVPEDKAEAVLKLGIELKKIFVSNILAYGEKVDEWKERIKNGEVKEIDYCIGNEEVDPESMIPKLAQDITSYKTEEGRQYNASFTALTNLSSTLSIANSSWDKLFKDPKYEALISRNPTTDSMKQMIEEAANKKNIDADKAMHYGKLYRTFEKKTEQYGFRLNPDYQLDNGKVSFEGLPKKPQLLTDIENADTPEKLLKIREDKKEYIKNCDEVITISHQIAEDAEECINDLELVGKTRFKTDPEVEQKYNDMVKELKNLTLIGTDDFKVKKEILGKTKLLSAPGYKFSCTEQAVDEACKRADDYTDAMEQNPNYQNFIHSYRKTGKINEKYEDILNAVYDFNKNVKKTMNMLQKSAAKIGKGIPTVLKKTTEEELKHINKVISNKKYTDELIYTAEINIGLDKHMNALDQKISEANASNKVFIKHNDYDEAVRAMQTLKEITLQYREAKRNKALTKDDGQSVEEVRKKAKEAQEKIRKYVKRKEEEKKHKNSLDAKGTNRLNIMKESAKICDGIIREMKDASKLVNKEIEKHNKMVHDTECFNAIDSKIQKAQADAEKVSAEDPIRIISQGTVDALKTIKDLTQNNDILTEQHMQQAYEAIAKYGVSVSRTLHENKELDQKSYDSYIADVANDPLFRNACDTITRDSLLEIGGTDNITNVMAEYMNMKASNMMEKQTELLMANHACEKKAAQLKAIIDKSNDPNKDRYKEADASVEIQAADIALSGIEMLQKIVNDDREFTDMDAERARRAYAALAVQTKAASFANHGPISQINYLRQVKKITNDESFIKAVGPIDKNSIVTFLNDAKAPEKLMDKFLFNKTQEHAVEDAEKKKNKIVLDKDIEQIKRSNTVKSSNNMKI